MAAFFTAASTQYLTNAATPVTAAPFTVGFWLNTPSVTGSDDCLWSLTDTAAANDGWAIYKRATSNLIIFGCYSSVTYQEAVGATAVTSNAWTFVVARAISATNRRISILHSTGFIEHAQNTTSITPSAAAIDSVSIGAEVQSSVGLPMDGSIAEYAMWNADIQGDGAQLQNSTFQRLAFGGPFSLPHAIKNLVEYRSLRASLVSASDHANATYVGAGNLRQVWTNTNGATLGPHVPLPGSYRAPVNAPRIIAV